MLENRDHPLMLNDLVSCELGRKMALQKTPPETIASEVVLSADIACKLFSKSIRPEEIMNKVSILGNQNLGRKALGMVSVMA